MRSASIVTLLASCLLVASHSVASQQIDYLSGKWTYRSFANDPGLVGGDEKKALQLIFGEGSIQLSLQDDDKITGVIDFGPSYSLDISGHLQRHAGAVPYLAVMTGTGRKGTGTEGWIYEYKAFPAPVWPKGVDQRPALVGSVFRTVPHNGAPAGVTASFIILRSQ